MDRWLAEDKVFHMSGSFMAVTVLTWAVRKCTFKDSFMINWGDESDTLGFRLFHHAHRIAAALVFAAGIALEAYQVSTGADIFSVKDIAANCVGIALAVIVRR
jgi:hypothetical protein